MPCDLTAGLIVGTDRPLRLPGNDPRGWLGARRRPSNRSHSLVRRPEQAHTLKGTRFIRAFNLKAAYSFPDPSEVESADFDIPWTTNDPSVRPVAEALIRATGGTPVYEGGLENAREY